MKSTFSGTRFGGLYFAFQAAAVGLWWLMIYWSDSFRARFLPVGTPERDLYALLTPDLLLVAGGSLLVAVFFSLGWAWAIPLAWMVAGALLYITLYSGVLSWMSDSAWLSVALMTPAAFFSCVFALDLSHGTLPFFKSAGFSSRSRNVFKTCLQIAFVWTLLLGVLPVLIDFLGRKLSIPQFDFPGRAAVAVVAFLLASLLGLASGMTIADTGRGTPFPFDAPNRLVTSGPYARLRNPMIVSGLVQGISVGCLLGSWLVLVYVAVGGIGWQLLVKPAEEADLVERFGDEYRDYRRRVRCWWPRLTRYSARDAAQSESRAGYSHRG